MTSVSFISMSHTPPIKLYFLTTKYFQVIYQYLAPTVVIIRYRNSRLNKNFGSNFLVFRKCGVTPNRIYRGSLTLTKIECKTRLLVAIVDRRFLIYLLYFFQKRISCGFTSKSVYLLQISINFF